MRQPENRHPQRRHPVDPDEAEAWFAPRKYGIGSGLPIRWQGWALLASYMIALLAISLPGEQPDALRITLILAVTAVFLLVCARKTKGDWRWRNGAD